MNLAILEEIEPHWSACGVDFPFRSSVVAVFSIGSHSHGTFVPTTDPNGIDDEDYMAIVIPPKRRVIGLNRFEGINIKSGSLDLVVYEWGKYVKLLLKSNPNVLGTLWLRPQDVWLPEFARGLSLTECVNQPYYRLRKNADLIASKDAYPAFIGYAHGQLHRMTHQAFQGYMGAKRKTLVEKYGYDTKNAAHLIRLLRMGIEFLRTGEMNVHRDTVYVRDAQEIVAIKHGAWSLAQVQAEADRLFKGAEKAVAASPLPEHPDHEQIERVMLDGYDRWWQYNLKGGS